METESKNWTADWQRMEQAIDFLAAPENHGTGLEDAAAHIGLSPHHFQRVFARWAGVSPKRFQSALALGRAREVLDEGGTVLDAALEAGLSSPSRLHDLFIAQDGMTPGAHKAGGAGLVLTYGQAPSPFGPVFLAASPKGLVHLAFIDAAQSGAGLSRGAGGGLLDFAGQLAALEKRFPKAEYARDDTAAIQLAARAFTPAGAQGRAPLPMHLVGTNFQIKVWAALLAVPEGASISYQTLAESLGSPSGQRAVAGAVSRNPIAWIIPCHRVLRSNGALGGYYYGLTRKRAMLALESSRTGGNLNQMG